MFRKKRKKDMNLDEIDDYLWNGEKKELDAFFAERRRKGLGVGLDEKGKLVYERDLKRS